MFYDIPKEKILEEITESVKKELEAAGKIAGLQIEVERLEWLATGIRVFTKD